MGVVDAEAAADRAAYWPPVIDEGIDLCGCGKPMRHVGMCSARWAKRKSVGAPPKRRFKAHLDGKSRGTAGLNPHHPAVIEGRTLFPTRRIASARADRLLKSGEHSRKIGDRVTKGAWAGCKIFTLTLEERATCPRSCEHWVTCYGSGMPWSLRVQADGDLMVLLSAELRKLCAVHGRILVRMHVLGDFYSTAYVAFWRAMLDVLPGLHLFGYTARRDDAISREIEMLNAHDRAWIRWSNGAPAKRGMRAMTVDTLQEGIDLGLIVCPAQWHAKRDSICCGSCALCWTVDRDIGFMRHG